MSKSSNLIFPLIIVFSLSMTLSAQSNQKKLDQVELCKQMLGTWKGELGNDSIFIFKGVPVGDGIATQCEWQYRGKTFATAATLLGFTRDKENVVMNFLSDDGVIFNDIGKFISPTKLVLERYYPGQSHPVGISEVEFQAPDTYTWKLDWGGMDTNWEQAWTFSWKATRVNE